MSAGYERDRLGGRNVRRREEQGLKPVSRDGPMKAFSDVIVRVEDIRTSRRYMTWNHWKAEHGLGRLKIRENGRIIAELSPVREPKKCRQ